MTTPHIKVEIIDPDRPEFTPTRRRDVGVLVAGVTLLISIFVFGFFEVIPPLPRMTIVVVLAISFGGGVLATIVSGIINHNAHTEAFGYLTLSTAGITISLASSYDMVEYPKSQIARILRSSPLKLVWEEYHVNPTLPRLQLSDDILDDEIAYSPPANYDHIKTNRFEVVLDDGSSHLYFLRFRSKYSIKKFERVLGAWEG